MDKRLRQNIILVVTGVCLYAALMNLSSVISALSSFIGVILPIIVGAIIALFLSVPVNGMQKRLAKWTSKSNKKPSDKALRRISFVIVLLLIIFVIAFVFTLLIPELTKSLKAIYYMLEQRIPEWVAYLEGIGVSSSYLENLVDKLDLSSLFQGASNSSDGLISTIFSKLGNVFSGIATAGFGFIIGIYLTLDTGRTARHTRKLIYGFLSEKWADRIYYIAGLFKKSFGNFLTGQCVEAVILGCLMALMFTIFRLPYASLVGVITAFCAIIPYVGAFFSFMISVILTLLISPATVLRAAIVYLCVQFTENQFIYPRVVGSSVGMPPLYTLIAAMIGGKLFGIIGILFFIPLMAVVIEAVKTAANKRIGEKAVESKAAGTKA